MSRLLPLVAAGLLACGSGAASGTGGPFPLDRSSDTVDEVVAPENPEGFSYPSGTAQRFDYYRFDSLITVHPGGRTQVQTFGRTAYLRVSVGPDTSGAGAGAVDSAPGGPMLLVEFYLDSITQDPHSSLRQPVLDSVTEARWTALMAPNGGLGDIDVTRGALIGENLSGELARLFFPVVPRLGAAIGSSWTDSSEAMIGGLSVNLTEQALVTFQVPPQEADTQLIVQGRALVSRRGAEERGGQRIEARGTGVDSTSYRFGPGGAFWGASGADSVAMTFTVPAVGQSVTVYQLGRYRLARPVADSSGN